MRANTNCLLAISGAFNLHGGIAAANRLMIKSLSDSGAHIDIFSLVEHNNSIDTHYADAARTTCRAFKGNKVAFTLVVWKALAAKPYSLIIVDHINLASMLAPLRWAGLCRYLVWLYGIEIYPPAPNLEGRLGLLGAWRRLAISDFTRDQTLLQFANLPIDVCELALDPVRHPMDDANSQQISRSTTFLEAVDGSRQSLNKHVILSVGRMDSLQKRKGHDTLILAMPQILSEYRSAQLVLVGDGTDRHRLSALVRSQPGDVQRAIFMPGYVADDMLTRLYQACFVFAMPSRDEGFGLVHLEAMRWSKPCIGSRNSGAQCIIQDGKTGLLIDDPTSSSEVASKLMNLLGNPQMSQDFGHAGSELVRSHYLFPHFHERFQYALED